METAKITFKSGNVLNIRLTKRIKTKEEREAIENVIKMFLNGATDGGTRPEEAGNQPNDS